MTAAPGVPPFGTLPLRDCDKTRAAAAGHPLSGYLSLLRGYRYSLAFGFGMAFASSIGQTFFIGIFGPSLRGEFGLDHTGWSAIYMAGTLLSAFVLPWTGQQIDRLPLMTYSLLVAGGLVLAAAFMAALPSLLFLVPAIFLLRQAGQGLASHTGITAMARHFRADRGKAVAIASLGFSAGEALLPLVAVLAIAGIGWRATYGVTAILTALLLPALIVWLLRRQEPAQSIAPESPDSRTPNPRLAVRSRSRREVLRHGPFYLMLPALLAPGAIATALFFHHLALAEMKGWAAAWITGSYWVFALGAVSASLLAGPLIDRLTAARVLPAFLLPMTLSLLILGFFDAPLWAWPYLLLLGVTAGIAHIGMAAFWAEAYGLDHLGAIRAMMASVSVFATAVGPLAMGAMMDAGLSVGTICASFAAYCLAASALMLLGLRGYRLESDVG
ncbi:MAG TPA: MFS transporter [Kiloniellaceae bacterium]|nr:MFS transporter [Kiloniellaceae bacterium]